MCVAGRLIAHQTVATTPVPLPPRLTFRCFFLLFQQDCPFHRRQRRASDPACQEQLLCNDKHIPVDTSVRNEVLNPPLVSPHTLDSAADIAVRLYRTTSAPRLKAAENGPMERDQPFAEVSDWAWHAAHSRIPRRRTSTLIPQPQTALRSAGHPSPARFLSGSRVRSNNQRTLVGRGLVIRPRGPAVWVTQTGRARSLTEPRLMHVVEASSPLRVWGPFLRR